LPYWVLSLNFGLMDIGKRIGWLLE